MKNKFATLAIIVIVAIGCIGFIGYCKDIQKLTQTNFDRPYKAEIIYGIGAVTGLGAFIGWMDIQD